MSSSAGAPAGAVSVGPRWLPGLLVTVVGAGVAWLVHVVVPGIPWLTAALVLGVVLGSIPAVRPALGGALAPGLTLAAKRLLRIGIVLLGLKLSLGDIAELGWTVVGAIAALVVVSFAVTLGIARLLRLPGDEPVLLAAGFSICGVSAIGAVRAARRSSVADAAAPTALVTLFGTVAIVVLPALASVLGLSERQFGAWAGASVHDVGQVVATAGVVGGSALAIAVVVKLTRVLMLAPMVAVASVVTRRQDARGARGADAGVAAGADAGADAGAGAGVRASAGAGAGTVSRPPIVPLFIMGFVVLVLVNSLLPIPDVAVAIADALQSTLLACALVAIGASLRLERLARSGLRGVAAGALSWAVILVLALGVAVLVGG